LRGKRKKIREAKRNSGQDHLSKERVVEKYVKESKFRGKKIAGRHELERVDLYRIRKERGGGGVL